MRLDGRRVSVLVFGGVEQIARLEPDDLAPRRDARAATAT